MTAGAAWLTPRRRGLLLDLGALLFNLICLALAAPLFTYLIAWSTAGFAIGKLALAAFCLACAGLQPVAALLKRSGAHQRNPNLHARAMTIFLNYGVLIGLGYFALQLTLLIMTSALLTEALRLPEAATSALFGVFFLGLPLLALINTGLVFLFFWNPGGGSWGGPLMVEAGDRLGDVCLFLNMLCFQAFWWYLLSDPQAFGTRPADLGGWIERLLALAAMNLFFYVPPRLLYWAEDFSPKLAGWGLLLANLPVLVRGLLGLG